MATATATETAGPHEPARKRPYVVVFGILAVVTLAELNVYSLGIPHLETITILVVLATIKASLVVAYYMHIRCCGRRTPRVYPSDSSRVAKGPSGGGIWRRFAGECNNF